MDAVFQVLPFKQNRPFRLMVAWLVIFWLLMSITPVHRFDWMLENILVLFYTLLLVFTYKRFQFSNTSYFLFTIFMTLHLIGAHYTYAQVPFGFWMQEWFGLERNHYDRIVHLGYGLLIAYPFYEVLVRVTRMRVGWAHFLTVNVILSFSGFFEILETVIVLLVRPDLGQAYLGMQGDIWDAQWDMGLATIGATIAMLVTYWQEKSK